jgi:hypothetical protein
MRNLLLTAAAFAALVMGAPIGTAHAADSYAKKLAEMDAEFNHTRVVDLAKITKFDRSLKACSAKFVNDWNSDATGDRNFPMPSKPCVMNSESMGVVVCNSVDCVSTKEWITNSEDIAGALPIPGAIQRAEAADDAKAKAKVSKATVALISAWSTMKDECNKDPVGGGKVDDNYPASCRALLPISKTLAKAGCEMNGDDKEPEAFWTCGGRKWQALQ